MQNDMHGIGGLCITNASALITVIIIFGPIKRGERKKSTEKKVVSM